MSKFAELLEPLIEWVYHQTMDDHRLGAEIRPFCADRGLTANDDWGLLYYGTSKGLLTDDGSLGTAGAALTPAGLAWMEQRLHRRADPLLRAAAARNGLLVWLWEQKQAGVNMPIVSEFLQSTTASFEGEPFRDDELDRAAEHLKTTGLIKGAEVAPGGGVHLRPRPRPSRPRAPESAYVSLHP
jgi:hypothetical protein